ncbi:hypothetical protein V6Z92_001458 [Aspergillus fumigatus]
MDGTADPPQSNRTPHGRQAACLNCRRSKIRCKRSREGTCCDRCKQANLECIVPSHHLGRQKGVKNKRKGLDKALHQIEEAIKRPKTDAAGSDAARKLISDLQDLLRRTQGHSARSEVEETSDDPDQSRTKSPQGAAAGDNLALDDAENPLQLLARASDLQFSSAECRDAPILSTSSGSQSSLRPNSSPNEDLPIARSFFVPVKAKLDLGPDMDPIELGLTTLHEAELLFSFFYENLAHTRWGLDPTVHTVSFVRSQSAFLFTSMLAAAARFNPSTAALSKRLTRHCTSLAYKVIVQRYRSVEIVLAFMVNVPWMAPGSSSGDDDTCSYIAMALTVALDLSLNKIVTPSTGFDSTLQNRLAKADCIDAKRALYMDGFEAVDPASEWGRRLLRRRERAWIALFVLERGYVLKLIVEDMRTASLADCIPQVSVWPGGEAIQFP